MGQAGCSGATQSKLQAGQGWGVLPLRCLSVIMVGPTYGRCPSLNHSSPTEQHPCTPDGAYRRCVPCLRCTAAMSQLSGSSPLSAVAQAGARRRSGLGGAGLPAHHSMATWASDRVMPRPLHTSPTAVPPDPQATCHAPSASVLLAQQARLTLLWNAWRVRWAQFRPQCKNQCRTPKLGRSRETPTNQKQA